MEPNNDLACKYRPTKLNEVFGNAALLSQIKGQVKNNEFPHCSLFIGPSGCGKTTIARIIAKRMGASDTDLTEINGGNDNGIDTIRTINAEMGLSPLGKARAYIFDECHRMTKPAQEAALKLLEEAKGNTYFFLCTTDPSALIGTVLNRCHKYEVSALSNSMATELILTVAKKEGIEIEEEGEVLDALLDVSEGSPRKCLVNLQRIASVASDDDKLDLLVPPKMRKQSIDLCRIMVRGNASNWSQMAAIIKDVDDNPEQLRHMMMSYMEKMVLSGGKGTARYWLVMDIFSRDTCYFLGRRMLTKMCYEALVEVNAVHGTDKEKN